jgi:geranylgeranyl pyrophosphate synthase
MSFPHSLQQTFAHKSAVDAYLQEFLKEQQVTFATHEWSSPVFEKLSAFVVSGKSVRSTLLLRTAELLGYKNLDTIVPLAAAIELLHSGILIQDDIMDKDENRRGQSTLHTQFTEWALSHQLTEPAHVGESLATCAADSCFFSAHQLLSKVNISRELHTKIQELLGKEFSQVTLAQMTDVVFGYDQTTLPTMEAVLQLYQYKTGRYTISMPLMLAAAVTDQAQQAADALTSIGEEIGILFQLGDDYLNLYGTPETGKSVGSDLRENKKTIYRLFIEEAIKSGELSSDILNADLNSVLETVRKSSVFDRVEMLIADKNKECNLFINKSILPDELKQLLSDLTVYVSSRTR